MTEQKNKLAEYQEKKDKILRMLEEIQIQIGDNELKDAIVQKQTKLKNDRFVVSVFGHFSNGKSTFLNALMGFGEEILTEDDAASTATITRLRYLSLYTWQFRNNACCDTAIIWIVLKFSWKHDNLCLK